LFYKLYTIAEDEATQSRLFSARMDTSQFGNWLNFRNSEWDGKPIMSKENAAKETGIDQDFVSDLPAKGVLEFDYVSTTRPRRRARPLRPHKFEMLMDTIGAPALAEKYRDDAEASTSEPDLPEEVYDVSCEARGAVAADEGDGVSEAKENPGDPDQEDQDLYGCPKRHALNRERRLERPELEAVAQTLRNDCWKVLDLLREQVSALRHTLTVSEVKDLCLAFPASCMWAREEAIIASFSALGDLENFHDLLCVTHTHMPPLSVKSPPVLSYCHPASLTAIRPCSHAGGGKTSPRGLGG